MSYLTQSEASLLADIIAGLEDRGFDYNPLTTSLPQYLATCLGDATAYKRKSVAQMLAELNSISAAASFRTSRLQWRSCGSA
ncbi:MAG: hypothetical protein EOS76_01500 [Mesorhizobium sp.]|uniref:hypothetical protein n=1 Tax=unclassified Mesorhizobium TaxID=325217 RepID=UPI000F75B5FC|nr:MULTISPECIES: hypothetical protein [unclassified Mesorhizobium]RVC82321.1 hypothetical protein EN766_01310 [Mesorhizobium sp. M2A.F.Ca.ET.046.02.1.1]AZO34186.1 hypothetical protein EJ072_06680 [Mesorhizobium sp. M2A.F.Ca.ET.046.03.2.1]AZO71617.1 hypothetical protein EJ067_11060 [Mesorhizobium sp. M1D.F.Ca.ET.043.01.1.1]RWB49805.1 MAG: hypothetical protein EOQ44_01410 [Mesorhizobium sp.]RWE22500.1 MAG: hypothetical protein EOS76_01500 [Mesorhizobium sp.]